MPTYVKHDPCFRPLCPVPPDGSFGCLYQPVGVNGHVFSPALSAPPHQGVGPTHRFPVFARAVGWHGVFVCTSSRTFSAERFAPHANWLVRFRPSLFPQSPKRLRICVIAGFSPAPTSCAWFSPAGGRPAPRAGTRAQPAPIYRRETERFCESFSAVAEGNLRHAWLPVVHRQCTWRAMFGTGLGSERSLPPDCVPPVHFL
jgi:hypothetical protein